MSLTLYGLAMSRAGRCLWALEELGVAYEHVPTDFKGGNKTPEFLAINPNGRLPALKHDDLCLFESMAINLYLARAFGKSGLQPDDEKEAAQAAQWSFWVMTECEQPLLYGLLHTLGLMGFEQSAAKVQEQREALERPLAVLDGALTQRQHLVGNRFTVADLNVASVFLWASLAKMNLAPHKNVQAWLDRCLSRPACKTMGQIASAEMAKMG